MRLAIASYALAAAGLVMSPVLVRAHEEPSPLCDDGVKKPTGDDGEKPPKASTDPLCGGSGDVKKPTGDDEKNPPKS